MLRCTEDQSLPLVQFLSHPASFLLPAVASQLLGNRVHFHAFYIRCSALNPLWDHSSTRCWRLFYDGDSTFFHEKKSIAKQKGSIYNCFHKISRRKSWDLGKDVFSSHTVPSETQCDENKRDMRPQALVSLLVSCVPFTFFQRTRRPPAQLAQLKKGVRDQLTQWKCGSMGTKRPVGLGLSISADAPGGGWSTQWLASKQGPDNLTERSWNLCWADIHQSSELHCCLVRGANKIRLRIRSPSSASLLTLNIELVSSYLCVEGYL